MASVYDSERLAAGYAFDRPPVHRHILAPVRLRRPAGRALDIGCGAGVSTAALAPLAEHVVGLEPVPAMLAHRRSVAPSARFAVGAAERLPFAAASFDLVAAAGSLNYADLAPALAEVARVLTPDGVFLLYDFSTGRPAGDAPETWFEEFRRRFPSPGGWRPLAVEELPLAGTGLRLLDHGDVEIPVPMALDDYLRYVLSEAGVDSAIACGAVTAGQARDWCRRTLAEVFRGGERAVVFRGYLATLAPDARD
ncbi:methyltransferase domain-containing protein [Nonomuraea phyllanthi]|uniref:class I SAM-dependent methyltransferase n=1 Tax=Nonomuraea phyllanthi TaxID=2219224 RepID=UPI00129403CD|nr:class I SAM-dependent methyltransferase [Nonomuraea phyllanthi]QFY10730.1 methyltransferase domain-containing protein [Nonomuraea phyllanthi]